ncbi:MAG TPA: cupredoxin family copper-binding protein [Paraburkholderia sp.]|nr:cupredoxin family copper-binding protein [Paraburkholderia sp.]HTR10767.1 cupredoxin family copper-binding protein [Paraburkholderia sp.]
MLFTDFRRAFIVSCGSGMLLAALAAGLPAAQAQEPNQIVIKDFMFSPMAITVKAGTTVTWKNMDGEPHTVVNDAGIFHSAALDQNDTYQYTFDKPGVYKVFCGIHPYMKATITVQ